MFRVAYRYIGEDDDDDDDDDMGDEELDEDDEEEEDAQPVTKKAKGDEQVKSKPSPAKRGGKK